MKLVLSLLLPFALICNAFAEDTDVLYCTETQGIAIEHKVGAEPFKFKGRFTLKVTKRYTSAASGEYDGTGSWDRIRISGSTMVGQEEELRCFSIYHTTLPNNPNGMETINICNGADQKLTLNIDTLRFVRSHAPSNAYITGQQGYVGAILYGVCEQF